MKRILFAGACDKSDVLLAVCKLLAHADLKVLLVDATREQHCSYAVQSIDPSYPITEYEGFDVARSLLSSDQLTAFFAEAQEDLNKYDCLLIDTDLPETIGSWQDVNGRVLTTNLERSTLLKNQELLRELFAAHEEAGQVRMFKLILQAVDCGIDETYIESTLAEHPILWTEPSYAIYLDDVDYALKIQNQFSGRLHVKALSSGYKETVREVAQLVSGLDEKTLKAAWKQAERGK